MIPTTKAGNIAFTKPICVMFSLSNWVNRCFYNKKNMIEVRNISDFNEYLESLLVQNECDDLEFKSAAGGFPGSFWDTYSAFANTEGGTIVFGVQENKGKFYLVNLTDEQIEKYRKDFWNNVNNDFKFSASKTNINRSCSNIFKSFSS